MSFAGKWIEPEIIMLSEISQELPRQEISQTQKVKYRTFLLICEI
jgi:hypothetical protein